MAIKKYKPTTPGRRGMTTLTFEEITKTTPERSLTVSQKSNGGRNNTGRITSRHQGGGHKQLYRIVDFKRNKDNIPATVKAIEYDPNRNANIALLFYADGEKRYILAPKDLNVGSLLSCAFQDSFPLLSSQPEYSLHKGHHRRRIIPLPHPGHNHRSSQEVKSISAAP